MTEREWLACTDPRRMLKFLRGVAGDRKLRLFTAACFNLFLSYLGDDRGEAVSEVLERHAEGSYQLSGICYPEGRPFWRSIPR